jgi:hypothetical protein
MSIVEKSAQPAQAPRERTLSEVFDAVTQLRDEVNALWEKLAPIALYQPRDPKAHLPEACRAQEVDDPSEEAREPSSAGAGAAYAATPPVPPKPRPGQEATPRQWFDRLALLARDQGIAMPPTPGPGVTDEQIMAENKRLKAAIQAAQQARQGGE